MLELKYMIYTSQPLNLLIQSPLIPNSPPFLRLVLFSIFASLLSRLIHTTSGWALLNLWNSLRKGVWAVKSEGPGRIFLIVEFNRRRNWLAACSCSAVQPRDAIGNSSKGCRWDTWALDSEVWTSLQQKSLNETFLLKKGSHLDLISLLQHC